MKIPVFTFPRLNNELSIFFRSYELEKLIICPSERIENLRLKEERVCRFCGLNSLLTSFNNEPHIIPHLLGNKYLISDFECDRCNKFFGDKYENDLANYLGISRTVFGVKNKKDKIPTFNSLGYKLVARREEFLGIKEGIKISRDKLAKNIFSIDNELGKAEIAYQKPSYTPIKVYKALLKIALSIIPEKYVADYRYAYYYLFNDNEKLSDLAKVLHYELPYSQKVDTPVCFLFKKLKTANRVMTHVFALYFQNHIFEFPIPLYRVDLDEKLYERESCTEFPLCPPLFLEPLLEEYFNKIVQDLSSNEKVSGEEEVITFSFDSDQMNNLKAYNPTTGEATKINFNAEDIIGFYIAPCDSKASFPED